MPTDEGQVVALQQQADHLQEQFVAALAEFDQKDRGGADPETLRILLINARNLGIRFYNHWENFVSSSDLLGAHRNDRWVQSLAEDCCGILKTARKHQLVLKRFCEKLGVPYAVPDGMTFAGLQRMVAEYLPAEIAERCKEEFLAVGLPVYGFQHPIEGKDVPDKGYVRAIAQVGVSAESDIHRSHNSRSAGSERTVITERTGLIQSLFRRRRTAETTREGTYRESSESRTHTRRTTKVYIGITVVVGILTLVWFVKRQYSNSSKMDDAHQTHVDR